jgi:hypothetical protein
VRAGTNEREDEHADEDASGVANEECELENDEDAEAYEEKDDAEEANEDEDDDEEDEPGSPA